MDYTLYVYKQDRRQTTGERLVLKQDFPGYSGSAMHDHVKYLELHDYPPSKGYRMEFCATMVRRRHALTGELFWERHDVPFTASPCSETYFSS
jgi:hypothetical protein